MHGRKAGLNRLSTGVGEGQERTAPRRAWAKGRNEPPLDGRGRRVGTNRPSTGVGVVFLKKSTAPRRAWAKGRNEQPLDGRGRGVGTNGPSTGVGVVFLKNQPHLGGRGRGVFC